MSDENKNILRGPYTPPPETEPVTLRTADDRRDELLAIAATILGNQQGVMSGMVHLAGTQVEIKVTSTVRSYTTAAVMLARHLIETVDATTTEGDQ